jgi:exonuclease III
VLLLQETWLFDFELHLLSQIHDDFYSCGVSSIDSGDGLIYGRPYGGVAFLWRKSLGSSAQPVYYDDSRLVGLQITDHDTKLLLVNTYLPCSSDANLEDYLLYLNKLDSIISTSDTVYNMVLGDFNADTMLNNNGEIQQLFGRKLLSFCSEHDLVLSDHTRLHNMNTYTFVSFSHGTTSWLDHAVSTTSMDSLVENVSVDYSTISSDHLPLCVTLDFSKVCAILPAVEPVNTVPRVKWESLTEEEINAYNLMTETYLSNVNLDLELLLCDDPNCSNNDHIRAIDAMYDNVLACLSGASAQLLSRKANKYKHQVPGWNEWVKEHHSRAREAFLVWRSGGSPRAGVLFDVMKRTRALFKLALRQCRVDKDKCVSDSLAEKLLRSNNKSFWKEVHAISNSNVKVQATTIDGTTGDDEITESWRQHYSTLLNSLKDTTKKESVVKNLEDVIVDDCDRFSAGEVENAIHKLKKNKSSGLDNITSEHLIYASRKISVYLSLIFNCTLFHGHLPVKLLETVLIPLVKDRKGVLTDRNNYRPIAITCVVSKVLETLILGKVCQSFSTSCHQFGFKEAHSTDLCVFALKEIINFYNAGTTPVYACYLDAAKAFDKINYWILLDKLLDRQLPKCYVRLFMVWFITQNFFVRWGNTLSTSFSVSNGVRQGGILSPYFFNIYVDDLSKQLASEKVGCYMNNRCMNHLFYADDTILLAPTVHGLQRLIDVCKCFGDSNDITYNFKKSVCTAFIPNVLRNLYIPQVFLGSDILKFVHENKYLGVFICADCTDDVDVTRQMKSLYRNGNLLTKRFMPCSVDVKERLFKAFCYGLYGVHLWHTYSKRQYKRCIVAYNDIFRKLFFYKRGDSISSATVLHSIDTFNILRRRLIFSFIKRVVKSENKIIRCLCNSVYFVYGSSTMLEWAKCLTL